MAKRDPWLDTVESFLSCWYAYVHVYRYDLRDKREEAALASDRLVRVIRALWLVRGGLGGAAFDLWGLGGYDPAVRRLWFCRTALDDAFCGLQEPVERFDIEDLQVLYRRKSIRNMVRRLPWKDGVVPELCSAAQWDAFESSHGMVWARDHRVPIENVERNRGAVFVPTTACRGRAGTPTGFVGITAVDDPAWLARIAVGDYADKSFVSFVRGGAASRGAGVRRRVLASDNALVPVGAPKDSLSTVGVVAGCSTWLLGADSYLRTLSGVDPLAPLLFERAVNCYCGLERLFFAKPEGEGGRPTPLLSLWREFGADVRDGLGRAEQDGVYDLLRESYVSLLTEWPDRVSSWLGFQLCDARIDELFWKTNELRWVREAGRVVNARSLPPSARVFLDELSCRPPLLQGESRDVAASFGSVVDFVLAYGFYGFAKGYTYPLSLPMEASYWAPWYRERALPSGVLPVVRGLERLFFPWGQVLCRVLVLPGSAAERDGFEDEVRAGLERLRSFNLAQYDEAVWGSVASVERFIRAGLSAAGFARRVVLDWDVVAEHYRLHPGDWPGPVGLQVAEVCCALPVSRALRQYRVIEESVPSLAEGFFAERQAIADNE